MKTVIGIGAVIIAVLAFFVFWDPGAPRTLTETSMVSDSEATEDRERALITSGHYEVDPARSQVNWAGKKPLIEGYINSGSIAIESGDITVDTETDTESAEFIIDMNTLSVSETPTKPGRESALEGHLKGQGWFNVAEFPTATFVITDIAPQEDTTSTFIYTTTGELTLKGETHELTFPARIYLEDEDTLRAEASLEFDRTKWGITSGSGSFFDDLADNAVSDMVALSFVLVAERQEQ